MDKDIEELNYIINQLILIDIYRTFHLATAIYTFLPYSHGTFTKIVHILGHKTNFNKY